MVVLPYSDTFDAQKADARTLITLLGDTTKLSDVAESHLAVVEAIRSGDPKRAGRTLRRHVEQFAGWIPEE